MNDASSRSAEYDRGFLDGYAEGRRGRRGLGFVVGAIILIFVLGTVVVNVLPARMAEDAGETSRPIQLPSDGPGVR
jgi:hypothetical protein